MDYRQGQFYHMQNNQSAKMPFYMTYPMQNMLLEEAEYERDIQRLRGLYPKEVCDIHKYVEEECDKMEYDGSLMFDEYPDRLMLRKIIDRIYNSVNSNLKLNEKKLNERKYSEEKFNERKYHKEKFDGENFNEQKFEEEPYGELIAEELRTVGRGRPHGFGERERLGLRGFEERERLEPYDFVERERFGHHHHHPFPGRPWYPDNPGVRDIIEILLYQEMYNRRCRHKRCRRWW
ncbi:hypothetical protein LQZ18_15055 [Lachnospiraceae bacterium ZAX-1]